jgi:hypothetical protein
MVTGGVAATGEEDRDDIRIILHLSRTNNTQNIFITLNDYWWQS